MFRANLKVSSYKEYIWFVIGEAATGKTKFVKAINPSDYIEVGSIENNKNNKNTKLVIDRMIMSIIYKKSLVITIYNKDEMEYLINLYKTTIEEIDF